MMWRKPEEGRPAAPAAQVPAQTPMPAQRVEPSVRSVAGLTAEVVQPSGGIITSTILIKGEISGSEDLYIDGEVQGTIELSNGRVTIGPHGKISADVDAAEIVVRGHVTGALFEAAIAWKSGPPGKCTATFPRPEFPLRRRRANAR